MPWISLRNFRTLSFVEASSFLILLGVAMPLKYAAGQAWAVTVAGTAHGWIFVVYLVFLALAARKFRWKTGRITGAVAASVLPFGPFVFDRITSSREA